MKLGKRLSLLAAAALMAGLVPAIGANAQATSGCTLSATDCQLLTDAAGNLAKESSFVQDFEFTVSIKGANGGDINVTGTGPFGLVSGATVNSSDPTAAFKAFQLQMDISGSSKGGGQDQSGTFSMIITDGVFYFKTATTDWQGLKLSDLSAMGTSMMSSMSGAGGAGGAGGAAQYAQIFTDPAVLQSLEPIPRIKGLIPE